VSRSASSLVSKASFRSAALTVALLGALPSAAWGKQAPPTTPILRVETAMHTALVRSMAYDARRDRLFTASDDKTVRIWQLPKGRLIRSLRVPIATGFEGRLYAMDVHADGRTIAAGGWTGWEFDGEASIYLLNGDT
jgi:WD40 repeat protein